MNDSPPRPPGTPSLKGWELILAFLLALFLNLPHLFAQSPNYNIGDVITNPDGSKGVVFWLAPDGSGGWMCALNDVSGTYKWSTQNFNISGFPALPAPITPFTWQAYATVTADTAGYSHTQKLRAAGNATSYPAAYAVDFAHGWYLPAIGQLLKLYAQQPTIRAALVANGGSEISRTNHYWSSTYATTSSAYYLYNPSGYWSTTSKSTAYYVRPVRSFTCRHIVYDTTLTYLWSTGATTPYAQISPTASSTYTVTATSGFGCSNTAEVSVVVANGSSQTLYDTICAGSGGYGLNGFNLSAAQTARSGDTVCVTTLSQGVCSTTVTLRLHRKAPATATITASICPGECYYLNGMELCNAGTYVQHLTAANGCDSTLTLHLNVNNPVHQSETETTCGSYEWHGQTYTESGVYTHAHEDANGCQQVDTLHLTVNNPAHQSETATACGSYEWHGQSYTESGVYAHAHEDANGCQQVDTLHLTVNNPAHQSETATACGSYEWHGQTYTESGVYTHAHEDANGCQQVDTLHLTVNNPVHQSDTATTCGSYEWHGQTYTESGIYTHAHEDANGCQQVDTLHLTVNNLDTVRFNETVCQGEPYVGHGFNIPADSTMVPRVIIETVCTPSLQTGCDSTVVLTLTVNALTTETLNVTVLENDLPYILNGTAYDTAGTFVQHLTNAAGCDSTLTLNLTVHYNQTTRLDSTICADALPLVWNGITFNAAGTQSADLTASTGADSTVVMTLTVNALTTETLNVTVLENDLPYILNGTAYDTAGTFVQHLTNANGCDSTLTLNLTIYDNQTTHLDSTVCANALPLVWNGVTFTAAGTQTIDLTASTGADSTVVMTLHVNALTTETLNVTVLENDLPYILNGTAYDTAGTFVQHLTNANGCDSTLTLNLTIYDNQTTHLDSTICADALPLTWNGITFTAAGTQSADLTASTGADSTVVMTLHVNALTADTLNITVLENDLPYLLNGTAYDTAGTFVQTLTNANGCDSTLTLNLTVHYNQTTRLDSTICANELPLVWNGLTFTAAGTQSADLTAATGADSTVVMTLTVNALTADTLNVTVVENDLPYILNGTAYNDAGTFVQHLTNANGCDSTLTLHLTVHYNQTTYLDSTICADALPLTWNGITFTAAGTQSADLTASTGADSTVVMTLHVNALTADTLNITVLENDLPYLLNGTAYDTAGTFVQTLTNANGCDSTLTLNLTVHYNQTTRLDSTICANELPLVWNGLTFTAAGTQSADLTAATGADSTVVMTLTVNALTADTLNVTVVENDLPYVLNGTSYNDDGTYVQHLTNANGCDSTLTLHLTVHYNQTTYLDSTICADALPLAWNGITFNATGTQSADLTASTGADSTVVMTLHVNALTADTLNITVLENELPYMLNGTSYDTAGTFVQTLTNAANCDSILTLNLTVHYNQTTYLDSTICADELPLTWNGITFTAAGTQNIIHTAYTGADSTVVMTLTVNALTTETLNVTVVENDLPYILNGTAYSDDGIYVQHLTNANGCDSTLTLNLTVYRNVTASADSTVCADALPLIWNGVTFTAAGTQTVTLIAQSGIDSLLTMTLHVNPMPRITANSTHINCHDDSTGAITATAVQGTQPYTYQWTQDQTSIGSSATLDHLATGTYHLRVTDARGCTADSSFTLVSLYAHTHDTLTTVVCQGEPFIELGFHIPADSTMTPHLITETQNLASLLTGCDSVVTLLLTVNPAYHYNEELTLCDYELPFTFRGTTIEPGAPEHSTMDFSYSTENGCDSVFTLDLTVIETDLEIISPDDFCEDAQADLIAQTDLEDFHWSTGEETNRIHITAPGSYSVTASTGSCEATASVQVPQCDLVLYLPNAITPGNYDGLNDYFCIPEWSRKMMADKDFEIAIYNRWGELVFYSTDKNFKWNGEFKGQIVHNNIYSYTLKYKNSKGFQSLHKGNITVL